MLNKGGAQKEKEAPPPMAEDHSEAFREELISILEQGIEVLGPDCENNHEVEDARQAVTYLKQN